MATVIGHDFNTPVSAEGYPRRTRNDDAMWQYEEKFYVKKDFVNDHLPAHEAVKNGMTIKQVEVLDNIPGFDEVGVSEVTLTWEGEGPEDGNSWNGSGNNRDVSYESDTTRKEQRIEDHPDWPSLSDADKQILQRYYPVFVVISVSMRRITRQKKSSFRFTESMILGDVNRKKAPDFLAGASDSKWMNFGRSIRFTKGDSVEITESWQYDYFGWSGALTPFVSLQQILAHLKRKGN